MQMLRLRWLLLIKPVKASPVRSCILHPWSCPLTFSGSFLRGFKSRGFRVCVCSRRPIH